MGDGTQMPTVPGMADLHLAPSDSIAALVSHPAFAGFGRLLLPYDGRPYDERLRIEQIGTLLPYHSEVQPAVIVSALNRMIDDASMGRRIFFDIYSDVEKRRSPDKVNTGLFFLRGKPGRPFALIAPGGGFAYVGAVHEGFPYAQEINGCGYNAFVLRYRAGYGARAATEDMAAALSYIIRHAAELDVAGHDYSLWGSSAGARMAASIASRGASAFGGDDIAKPAAVVMAYTAHADYVSNEPPTYAVVGERDAISPPATMQRRVNALRRQGTDVEFQIFADLGHGFGTGAGTSAAGWIGQACRFWEKAAALGGRNEETK
ncbi:esterase/lipase [Rhizobium sp. CF142]|nr:esterase/lipase [Rhizobium sp. CF142]